MRIVHLIWSLNVGGSEMLLVDIANEQSLTDEVIVVIGNSCVDLRVLDQFSSHVQVKQLGRPPGTRNPWYLLRLYRMLRTINADVIHAHLESFIKIIRFLDTPRFLTVHDTGLPMTSMRNKYDAVFSISDAVKKDISDRYPGISAETILNGINISSVTHKSHFGNSPFRIVQVSRLNHEKKGQDVLLRALKYVNATIGVGNVTVDFIGDGASREYLVSLANELEVGDQCNYLGKRSRSYIYQNLYSYDLLVQPSRFEGFGLTVVEAMAALVPVLVSNIEGPMEIIDNGKYGYFFDVGDHMDCGKAIVKIIKISGEQDFAKERRRGEQYVQSIFNISSTAQEYRRKYSELIDGRK